MTYVYGGTYVVMLYVRRAEYVLHCKQKSLEAVHSRTGRRLAGQVRL